MCSILCFTTANLPLGLLVITIEGDFGQACVGWPDETNGYLQHDWEMKAMSRWNKCLILVLSGISAACGAGFASQLSAHDGALTELYGYGVHRYYAGDYAEAQNVLNMVIDAGSEDPRPHYFRGLVQYQQGMQDAAKSDFERAAELEARGKGSSTISQALQRIQGPVRKEIEMARLMARVAVQREEAAKKQYSESQMTPIPTAPSANGANSNLPPGLAPEAKPAAPGSTTPATPDKNVDPFKDDQPAAPAAPATPDSTPPASPFGNELPPMPAPTTPPAEPAVDPFATPAPTESPAATDPFK